MHTNLSARWNSWEFLFISPKFKWSILSPNIKFRTLFLNSFLFWLTPIIFSEYTLIGARSSNSLSTLGSYSCKTQRLVLWLVCLHSSVRLNFPIYFVCTRLHILKEILLGREPVGDRWQCMLVVAVAWVKVQITTEVPLRKMFLCFIIKKQFMGIEFIGTYSLYFEKSIQF